MTLRAVLVPSVLSFLLCVGINSQIQAETISKTVSDFTHLDQLNDRQREKIFRLALKDQQALFNKSEQRLAGAEAEQERLKSDFDQNEVHLSELASRLAQRTGTLGEVFGVAKETAIELMPVLENSLTSADHPNREVQLLFAESKRIPTVNDLQALLMQLQLEMKATGEVKQFESLTINAEGVEQKQQVLRFGVFAATSLKGDYLAWDVSQQYLTTLSTQPPSSAKENVQAFVRGEPHTILLDPSRGELFALLDRMPSLIERIKQGGEIGYLILSLGLVGILVAFIQLLRLLKNEIGVRRQLSHLESLKQNNPLGRVLLAASSELSTPPKEELDESHLELRVDEAILHELPVIEQGQNFLKLLAAVAPLLGLLGTVVGMITTFQSITLFGTSDPKLMANGISQALMTTVLGLVVAIPLLFCHSLLATRGRRLVQMLQEKSLAALAHNFMVKQLINTEKNAENFEEHRNVA